MLCCPVGPNCPCVKQACPPNQLEKCGMRYRQPQRPRSYKPIRTYCCPLLPMDGCTVYKTSYMKHCTRRTGPIPPRNALCIPQGLFSRETTQQHDYRCWPCAGPAKPIVPCGRSLLGEGPMQSLTTQRHDYVCKSGPPAMPIKPPTTLRCSGCPLEETTITQLSFQRPDPCKIDPAISYRPFRHYKQPEVPMETSTIQRMSYPGWTPGCKEFFPWASKGKWHCPTVPMDNNTTYNNSYLLPGDFEPACTLPCCVPVVPCVVPQCCC
ncbi:stabilizer of axonemal microtubules 1 [Schistocerca gregaria]|uniref:stabilizer of axonemal microtubules 1 n=1 Tax=Schistocerca gregaria TaxID=7010 RepID=UPI00211E7CB8|nr:stabilizer of axonemal microtubules 1 [Schistocerca gregaria]